MTFVRCLLGGFLIPLLVSSATEAAARRPNIIVLFADDLGYGELGCQGNPQIPTPHIDSIAKNGIRFTDGYVSAPFCCPSRAGLLTGRYQTRFGHEMNVVGKSNLEPHIGLPLEEKTLASHLKEAGYATGCVGKWHLGGTEKFHPRNRGFDEFYGFLHEGHFYVPPPYKGVVSHLRTKEPPYDADNPVLRGRKPIIEQEYLTEALTREALGFMDRHREQPFFLYLAYNAIHSPMQTTLRDLKRFEQIQDEHRRVFAGMLAAMDDSIGAVLARLEKLGLEENTLIFFLSDNGGPTAELTSSNKPLRGGKGQLWEGGIRIPFLVQWKGHLPSGKVYRQPVISLDILPTALAAAEAKIPDRLDGVSLLPYLRGEKEGAPHERLFWRYGTSIALRRGEWKLVRQQGRGQQKTPFQLYNISRDIGEETNLAEKEPALARGLEKEMEALNREMATPLWGVR